MKVILPQSRRGFHGSRPFAGQDATGGGKSTPAAAGPSTRTLTRILWLTRRFHGGGRLVLFVSPMRRKVLARINAR